VILVDTGPLVALFDRKDAEHDRCVKALKTVREPLMTTIPVLTEAFHMLGPSSEPSDRLRDFIDRRGLSVWFFDTGSLNRAFELMEIYADHPMGLADASMVASAESLGTRKVFTIDRRDFETYKIRKGHRHYPIDLVPSGAGR
jgi:predicted nucleic acid-binding protein